MAHFLHRGKSTEGYVGFLFIDEWENLNATNILLNTIDCSYF